MKYKIKINREDTQFIKETFTLNYCFTPHIMTQSVSKSVIMVSMHTLLTFLRYMERNTPPLPNTKRVDINTLGVFSNPSTMVCLATSFLAINQPAIAFMPREKAAVHRDKKFTSGPLGIDYPWYLYMMVTQNMLRMRTYEGKFRSFLKKTSDL